MFAGPPGIDGAEFAAPPRRSELHHSGDFLSLLRQRTFTSDSGCSPKLPWASGRKAPMSSVSHDLEDRSRHQCVFKDKRHKIRTSSLSPLSVLAVISEIKDINPGVRTAPRARRVVLDHEADKEAKSPLPSSAAR